MEYCDNISVELKAFSLTRPKRLLTLTDTGDSGEDTIPPSLSLPPAVGVLLIG